MKRGQTQIVVKMAGLAALLLLCSQSSQASFSQASQSLAASAMGGAFVAKADDASALFINPAGLSQLQQGEASFMYGKPWAGVSGANFNQEYLTVALPLSPRWTMAAGGSMFDASGLMKEYEGILGAAFKVHPMMSVGANVSYLAHSYNVSGDALAESDPVFANGRSKGAVGLDMGVLLSPMQDLSLGLSARHANKPDVGLASEDRVPLELRAGGMLKLNPISLLFDLNMRDAGSEVINGRRVDWSLGGEWLIRDRSSNPGLAMRFGANAQQITTGFGLTMGNLGIDYSLALMQFSMQDNFGSHKIAMTFRFGSRQAQQASYSSKSRLSAKKSAYPSDLYKQFWRAP